MRKNQNFGTNPLNESKNDKAFSSLLKSIFALKELLNFDILHYSNTYNEKLPIIYANIRV